MVTRFSTMFPLLIRQYALLPVLFTIDDEGAFVLFARVALCYNALHSYHHRTKFAEFYCCVKGSGRVQMRTRRTMTYMVWEGGSRVAHHVVMSCLP